MAHDEALAGRIRTALRGRRQVAEIRMFGGLCFTWRGHMVCGVSAGDLVCRVGPAAHAGALQQKHARPMDFTGKPLTGFVYVAKAGLRTARQLEAWIDRAMVFAGTLPPKPTKKPQQPARKKR